MDQNAFFFDAPLTTDPVSLIPPKPVVPASIPTESEAFVAAAMEALTKLDDDIAVDDVLDAMGIPRLARVGWHRARIIQALSPERGGFQAYVKGEPWKKLGDKPTEIRYRRLAPLAQCQGEGCCVVTYGGVLCPACIEAETALLDRELEDRLNVD